MRPIDFKVDSSLCQALTCAELRFPRTDLSHRETKDLTAAFRFALIGLGAVHSILTNVSEVERVSLSKELRHFGTMIREHLEQERLSSFAHEVAPALPRRAQELFGRLFDRYLTLVRLSIPVDLLFSILVEDFVQANSLRLPRRLFFFKNRQLERKFDVATQESLRYTLNFIERRELDLDELPEIALLGE